MNNKYNNYQKGPKKSSEDRKAVIQAKDVTKENFADMAEKVIKAIKASEEEKNIVTSTQLRQFVPLINQIIFDNKGRTGSLSANELGQVQYLKTRFVYAAGRDDKVKTFLLKADILAFIDTMIQRRQKEDVDIFAKYYESLIAFHKFYGGKDQ